MDLQANTVRNHECYNVPNRLGTSYTLLVLKALAAFLNLGLEVPIFEKALMTFSNKSQKYRNTAMFPLWWHPFLNTIGKAWLGFLIM